MFKSTTSYLLAIIILAINLVFISSCKKDKEDNATPDTKPECLLMEMTYNQGNTMVFTYDAQERITTVKYSSGDYDSLHFEYNSKNQVIRMTYYVANEIIKTGVIEYNAQGKWSKFSERYTYSADQEAYILTAEYDSNGNRIKIMSNENETYAYEYAAGNMTKSVYTNKSGAITSTYTTTCEYYTDKENKLAAFEEIYDFGFETHSKNLLKKESSISSGSTPPRTYNYTYEYNTNGFPTKKSKISNGSGSVNSYSYTYQCK